MYQITSTHVILLTRTPIDTTLRSGILKHPASITKITQIVVAVEVTGPTRPSIQTKAHRRPPPRPGPTPSLTPPIPISPNPPLLPDQAQPRPSSPDQAHPRPPQRPGSPGPPPRSVTPGPQ
ncbi:uncharacterized protein LOC135100154 [Scylla paramamosain]|uniref:uncharacterized protein LOC135100154 n=1 Tax=Scylla paramamosain TaxID=85552 RepID=UPI0030828753